MPQPFKGNWQATPLSINERPVLAKHIGIIAALWANVEHMLGTTLALILRTEAGVAVSMYLAVKSEPARLSMMREAAQASLPEEKLDTFLKLIERVGNTGRQRDLIVHGLWAIPKDNAESMIWIDPRKSTKFHAMQYRDLSQPLPKNLHPTFHEYFGSFLEYKEQDFIDVETRISELMTDFVNFQRPLFQELFELNTQRVAQIVASQSQGKANPSGNSQPS